MPNRWLTLGFLLIMLASVMAGLRQCQGMRSKDPQRLRPVAEVAEELRAPNKWPTGSVIVKDQVPMKRVLFVCVENANRSQMAEAFARIHGAGKVEAYSAGSRPSGKVNPKAVDAMKEVGYDLTRHESKSLAHLPDVEFDAAVTMGCGDECPMVKAKMRVEWNIPDPKGMTPEQFREVRDLIETKVKELLKGLCADTR